MPTREEVLNSALAEVLHDESLFASAEETKNKSGRKRPDMRIYYNKDERFFVACECKIGQNKTKQKDVIKDAERWTSQDGACMGAVAVCYPESLKDYAWNSLPRRLRDTDDLQIAQVSKAGKVTSWKSGGVEDLVRMIESIPSESTGVISETLRDAINKSVDNIAPVTGRALSTILELPWDPKKSSSNDRRPASIACLIICNMLMLHLRMNNENVPIPGLKKLTAIRNSGNKHKDLSFCWEQVKRVDYVPVVGPALSVLSGLPANALTQDILGRLIEAVYDCAPHMSGIQLDHAGPLYHKLLQSARYDGSFYTSTTASILLAELAMPKDWNVVNGQWNDAGKLANLAICDPACGTGTLLMSAARTIESRYRSAGGGAFRGFTVR